jgi:hypothetical protein
MGRAAVGFATGARACLDGECAPVSCASYKLNSCGNRREWARSDVLVPTDLFPNLIIRGIEPLVAGERPKRTFYLCAKVTCLIGQLFQ